MKFSQKNLFFKRNLLKKKININFPDIAIISGMSQW